MDIICQALTEQLIALLVNLACQESSLAVLGQLHDTVFLNVSVSFGLFLVGITENLSCQYKDRINKVFDIINSV